MEYKHTKTGNGNDSIHFIQVMDHEFLSIFAGGRYKEMLKVKHGDGNYIVCYQEIDGLFMSEMEEELDQSLMKELQWTLELYE